MMRDVLCVRNLYSNTYKYLISLSRLVEKGFTIICKYNKAHIYDKRRLFVVGKLESGLCTRLFSKLIKAITVSIVKIIVLPKVERTVIIG